MHALLNDTCFPREILDAPVWCVASPDDEGKLKLPMNPYTREHASVTDPSTWGTFEDACAVAAELGYFLPGTFSPAVGHVLRATDGIFVIDFDKCASSVKVWDVQQQVMERFASYMEESQSGFGFHLYARGFLYKGKRFKAANVEMYGHARFIVATGVSVEDVPLNDHTLNLADFICMHAPAEGNFVFNDTAPENQAAAQMLYNNSFVRSAFLTPGGWRDWFTDQSTADMVFMKEILRHTKNHVQALALFGASPMAQRSKWQDRADYRAMTLENAALEVDRDTREEDRLGRAFILSMPKFEPEIPVIPEDAPAELVQYEAPSSDVIAQYADDYLPAAYAIRIPLSRLYMGITEQLPAAQELLAMPAYPSVFRHEKERADVWATYRVGVKNPEFEHAPLPGFLGEFARSIAASMLRPSLRLAEAIALQIAQTVVGRGAMVMNLGLNMFHLIVGSSGVGKSTAKDTTASFLASLEERYALPPFSIGDRPKSKEGLHSAIAKAMNHEFYCTLDESHLFLSDLSNVRPNPVSMGLGALLTDAFHKSDRRGLMNGSEASKAENSTNAIKRPYVVLSMSGLHKETLEALNGPLLKNGFVSRLYVTHVKDSDVKKTMNRKLASLKDHPQWMYDRFANLASFFDKFSHSSDAAFEVALPDFLYEKHARFSDWAHEVVTREDRAHYNRASVNALKLAAIVAIFDNPKSCTITEEIYDWACKASLCSLNYFEEATDEGMIGDRFSARQQVIINKMVSFYQRHPNADARIGLCKSLGLSPLIGQLGLIPYSWLVNQISGVSCFKDERVAPARLLFEILKTLDGAGELQLWHQDHKGTLTYTDPTGKSLVIRAGVVDAYNVIQRELKRRASGTVTNEPD